MFLKIFCNLIAVFSLSSVFWNVTGACPRVDGDVLHGKIMVQPNITFYAKQTQFPK
jgi:hypothetical protein